MDRRDLKIQALRERISNLSVEHEDRNADLRVELTMVTQERDQLQQRVQELETQNAEVVDAEVVSDSSDEN